MKVGTRKSINEGRIFLPRENKNAYNVKWPQDAWNNSEDANF